MVFGVSHSLSSLVFLFSMVCVVGAGWAGVILPDKVAGIRWILFVFVADGPADPGRHGCRGNAGKTCRHEWRHGTAGDVRHVACRQPSAAFGMSLPSAAGPGFFASGLAGLSLDRQEGLFLADFPLTL